MNVAIPILVVFFDILLPCALLVWTWKSNAQSRAYLLSIIGLAALYLLAIKSSILGYWHAITVFWPFIYLAILALIVLARLRKLPRCWFPKRETNEFLLTGLNVVFCCAWALVVVGTFRARGTDGEMLRLSPPLRNGTFAIIAGGGNLFVNPHTRAVKYALDITELNAAGRRARSLALFPDDLESYKIFGAEIIAPCSGEVLALETDEPDRTPLHPDDRGFGNFVAIFCQGHTVRLVHLRAHSVKVAVGDVVSTGQQIANVGNSGNSIEPHLHIDAVAGRHVLNARYDHGAKSVPISIDGRFLVKGDSITVVAGSPSS